MLYAALPIILFILIQRLRKHWKLTFIVAFVGFHAGIGIGFIVMHEKYLEVSAKITAAKTVNDLKEIKQSGPCEAYLLERIAGFHFKYHTRMCLYDGWRPPLLDPLASMAFMASGEPRYNFAPQDYSLPERIAVYKELFPEKAVVEDCKCSPATPENYFKDMEMYK